VRAKNIFPMAGGVMLTLASGIVVGQKQTASKFERYLHPASISAMDLAVLRANVDLIRPGGLTLVGEPVPTVSYSSERDEVDATVFWHDIGKHPLDRARSEIKMTAKDVLYNLRKYIPEVREEDFVLEVDWLKLDPVTGEGGREVFGQYKNGNVVFR
jgi:hypothetical protein